MSKVWIVALTVVLLGSEFASAMDCACLMKHIYMENNGLWKLSMPCVEMDMKVNNQAVASCAVACTSLEESNVGTSHRSRRVLKSYTRKPGEHGAPEQCSEHGLWPLFTHLNGNQF